MKNKRARSILNFYFKDASDAVLDKKIQQWLADDYHHEEKDDALKQIWNKQVQYIDKPNRYAYTSLKKMRIRLQFPEHSVQKIPLLYQWVFRIAALLVLYYTSMK
jgi:hypothetical protein